MALLASADPTEQRRVQNGLDTLRAIVRKKFRDPMHSSTLVIKPPGAEKALIAIYLFVEAHRADLKANMIRVGDQTIANEGHETCIVFGRSIDRWEHPYDALLVVTKINQ